MVPFLILVSLMCIPVSSQPKPRVIAIDGDLDISKTNEDLQLFEGDIMRSTTKTRRRRSIHTTDRTLWSLPIKYKLNWLLEMNAKGVILDAFEQLRLKTCIDFTPRKYWFEPHISLQWSKGYALVHVSPYTAQISALYSTSHSAYFPFRRCWSSVGRQSTLGQVVSIGPNCDTMGTVEHELLHALGFWHEQSRYDRDDYVTINWGNIQTGEEVNFEIGSNDTNSSMGTPYDYLSIMHYPENAFAKGNESTIITKLPEFQNIIGQRLDMSPYDVEELNRMYGCNDSISFLDHCSFDEGMCEMSSVGWQRVRQADGGPQSDHSNLGTNSKGSFMHFSTKRGRVGDSAILQTRRTTPRRSCKIQCLQFFYYHSGNQSDQLNIWIREFDSVYDMKGIRRLMSQIQGSPANHWQLHHVPLNATKTFQVEFEARKGTQESSGGFSVDDINLSETECPHQTWQIRNFDKTLNTSANNSFLLSPKYYSEDGYRYQIMIRLNKDYFGVFVRLVSGIYDDTLQWPCSSRQVTVTLLDQNPHIQKRMSKQRSLTTSSSLDFHAFFHRPRTWGTLQTDDNSEDFYANDGSGDGLFMSANILQSREFLKGGVSFFLISMQDISQLLHMDTLPCPNILVRTLPVQSDDEDGGYGNGNVQCTTLSSAYKTVLTPTYPGALPSTPTSATRYETTYPSAMPSTPTSATRDPNVTTPGSPEIISTDRDHNITTSGSPKPISPERSGVFSSQCCKTDVHPWVLIVVVLSLICVVCIVLGVVCKRGCSTSMRSSISTEHLLLQEQEPNNTI